MKLKFLEGLKLKLSGIKGALPKFNKGIDLKKIPRLKTAILVLIIVVVAASIFFAQAKLRSLIFKKPVAAVPVTPEGLGAPGEGQEAAIPSEPILVKVYKVQKKDFEDTLPLLGTVKGFKEIDLKFESTGVVDSFNFKEGERVERGEIIASTSQKDAILKLRYNEIELDKIQKLYDLGSVGKAKLDQVKLEVESAKRELDKTYLYAPQSGVLGTKDIEIGELATPNEKVGTLIDSKEVFVEVGVIEKDIGKVKMGQAAKAFVDTYPDVEFPGTVDSISPVIEGKSRTQSAKIKVKNPKGQLLPGMFARVLCAVYKVSGAVVIPNTALDKTQEGYVVYVAKPAQKEAAGGMDDSILNALKAAQEQPGEENPQPVDQEGTAEARPVKIDYRSAELVVIKEGLEEGDLVVIETQEKLKDGYKLIITESEEAAL